MPFLFLFKKKKPAAVAATVDEPAVDGELLDDDDEEAPAALDLYDADRAYFGADDDEMARRLRRMFNRL